MRTFVSTRGGGETALGDAVLHGLAPDGGLFVPTTFGTLGTPPHSVGEWPAVARWGGRALFPTMPEQVLDDLIDEALSFPMPLVEVEPGVHVLELFHGPTHAFKDVGARVLARIAAWTHHDDGRAGDAANRSGDRTILVATSGDTGGAVADAFHGVAGFRVVVLFPHGGVSDRQRRQMTTLGDNVFALAVEGSFDDCQRLAKEAFGDEALRAEHMLTSANSINIGRLLPQALYYMEAAAELGWDRPVRFVVPSGNLGNLCAGLFAHRMGMPARGFVAVTNENRLFVDVMDGGEATPRPSVATTSNAMDVGAPSNLERLLWMYGDDVTRIRRDVTAVAVGEDEALACQRDVHDRFGYLMDPHSAVAYAGHRRTAGSDSAPTVVLATAHPAKFPQVTEVVAGRAIPLPPGLASAMKGEERMTEIGPTLDALRGALDEVTK